MRDFFTKNLGFYLIPTKKNAKKVYFLMKNQKFRTKTPSKIPHTGMYQAPTSAASFPS